MSVLQWIKPWLKVASLTLKQIHMQTHVKLVTTLKFNMTIIVLLMSMVTIQKMTTTTARTVVVAVFVCHAVALKWCAN